MGDFKRSPSKVWWAEESLDWHLRSASGSPGSQDSGFSDAETSPPGAAQIPNQNGAKKCSTPQFNRKDILKERNEVDGAGMNLSMNYKEKETPVKSFKFSENRLTKSVDSDLRKYKTSPNTNTEPIKKFRYIKGPSKASKNLFNTMPKQKDVHNHQYAEDTQHSPIPIVSKVTYEANNSTDNIELLQQNTIKSLPVTPQKPQCKPRQNSSAPAVIINQQGDECVTSFRSDNFSESDCDSELECLFRGSLESPKHTSTPKLSPRAKMRHRKNKVPLKLLKKYQDERIPPLVVLNDDHYHDSVQKWLRETRHLYESEFMTTLQCKSIAAELNQKVSQMAAQATTDFRKKLSNCELIENEFNNLKSQTVHVRPVAQSLAGSLIEFSKNTTKSKELNKITRQCEILRRSNPDNVHKIAEDLYNLWKATAHDVLQEDVKILINKLEEPKTELELRATVTAITSLCLKCENLISIFTTQGAVQSLLIFCEKCDGSSLRAQILRALSTICCNTSAVRQFEKASGVQVIAEILEESSRPEPERSEAVALLAQVTAPWIEDNHHVNGLQEKARSLVKSLTRFVASTKCCQNLLLCVAALANVTTMENKCVKCVLHQNTLKVVLNAVKQRGSHASIYLLEQVSTLIANMSSLEEARRQLTEEQAPTLIMYFLQSHHCGQDVEKRLQQKSMIALSRLCGDRKAAQQIVDIGGVNKLVRLCREKSERYDSDAVLVAALATLRKIVDACGPNVIGRQDAQELIEPRLLDSFLTYSTQNESYV